MTWDYVSGSRNRILDTKNSENFRMNIHTKIKNTGLKKGECLYYEIVGFTDYGVFIMDSQDVEEKDLQVRYGTKMNYTYGCDENNKYQFYVYRITMTNEDGDVFEYPPEMVERRCLELGFQTVPSLLPPFLYTNKDDLMQLCEELSEGPSVLDSCHIKEGVVIRNNRENKAYKYKSFTFLILEDRLKANNEYIDLEEVS